MKVHYCNGMKHHGENACKYFGFEKYDWRTDKLQPAIFWLYEEDDYKYLAVHQGRKIVFWSGTDVLHLANPFAGKYINTVRDPSITHVCQNSLLQAELAIMGIHAIIRPLLYRDVTKYQPSELLTKDCYMVANRGRGIEYGESIFNALAWQFPEWQFHIFGIDPTIPIYCDNVKYYGWIDEEEMDETVKNFGICLRYNTHDGASQTVLKALLREQYCLTQIDYQDMTNQFRNYKELINYIEEISYVNFNNNSLYPVKSDILIKPGQLRVKSIINNFDFLKDE